MTDAHPREQHGRKSRRPETRYQPRPSDGGWRTCYAPAPGVSWTVTDREAVVSSHQNGRDYTLNPVGTAVWELLDGERPLSAVLGVLAESFDAPERILREDLLALIGQLRAEGLIHERR
jgi:hypothetical protein